MNQEDIDRLERDSDLIFPDQLKKRIKDRGKNIKSQSKINIPSKIKSRIQQMTQNSIESGESIIAGGGDDLEDFCQNNGFCPDCPPPKDPAMGNIIRDAIIAGTASGVAFFGIDKIVKNVSLTDDDDDE